MLFGSHPPASGNLGDRTTTSRTIHSPGEGPALLNRPISSRPVEMVANLPTGVPHVFGPEARAHGRQP